MQHQQTKKSAECETRFRDWDRLLPWAVWLPVLGLPLHILQKHVCIARKTRDHCQPWDYCHFWHTRQPSLASYPKSPRTTLNSSLQPGFGRCNKDTFVRSNGLLVHGTVGEGLDCKPLTQPKPPTQPSGKKSL